MQTNELLKCALDDLSDLKALNIKPIDVSKLTTLTDYMIIATGNSSRHVRSIADNLVNHMKKRQISPNGIESDGDGEWVLVDLGSIVVHIMQQHTRDFYNIEKLWSTVYEDIVASA